MNNPWLELSSSVPYVLDTDRQQIETFNSTAKPNHRIYDDLLPEPYLGNPLTASVILLSLNPGFSHNDYDFYADPVRHQACRDNLAHAPADYPFHLLNPAYREYSGSTWWYRHLKWLIQATSLKQVAKQVCCIEFFPYHSAQFAAQRIRLASQAYSFELVEDPIAAYKPILILRAAKAWKSAVSELKTSPFYTLNNPQRVWISPTNIGTDGFAKLVDAIRRSQ